MQRTVWHVDNGDGWALCIERFRGEEPAIAPVVMVPGYAMNAFILSFHPRGVSMIEYLVGRGFEVWTTELRGQGRARPTGPKRRYGLAQHANVDLPVALEHVRAHTQTDPTELLAVGCSLGASVLYAYLAHHPQQHGLAGLVSLGGPLRWDDVHPLVRAAFRSARVAGAARVKGTRRLARLALPVATRVPVLLSPYMNARHIDLSRADKLVQTVDDPVPHINRQLARWIRRRDLVVGGLDVNRALRDVDLPVLCVVANADGIVPAASVESAREVMVSSQVEVLRVGDPQRWYAHADLFINDQAASDVFEPLARWLSARC